MGATLAATRDERTGSAGRRPLVVAVDGALIEGDLSIESALQFVSQDPLGVWRLPLWRVAGKAVLKARLAERVAMDLEQRPLREAAVTRIRAAQAEGRPVYLASGADDRYVSAIAERVGGIDGVFASDGYDDGARDAKAASLTSAFGVDGFDYLRRELKGGPAASRGRGAAGDYIRALRPHQWVKNALVFLPLMAGHLFDPAAILAGLWTFLCFCAAASGAYIINDLLDLPADRAHPRKRHRPFASGAVPPRHGLVLAGLLMAVALAGALALSLQVCLVVGLYVVVTLGYSLALKREMLVDVITLGGLYTIRVLAGVLAEGAKRSPWLLMFCLFLFLSLAIVKRCSELVGTTADGREAVSGRGYRVADLGVMNALAAASGTGAVLVFALYAASHDVLALYTHPYRLFLVCPLMLYWIGRLLLLSGRGEMHDDPVVFAMTDPISLMTGVGVMAIVATSV